MKVYYAHCMVIYNTPQEERDIKTLESMGFEVFNPNCPEMQNAYKEHGMIPFFDKVKECDAIVFRATPDGSIPAGVYGEIEVAINTGKPVIELPSCIKRRYLDVEKTREYLKEVGNR